MDKKEGKTLNELDEVQTHVVDVKYHGQKMILPEGMSLSEAINTLHRRKEYLEEEVDISATFKAFPWDGAHALNQCLIERFGWVKGAKTPGFFGSSPPQMRTIETGPGQTTEVPWGRIELPGVQGFLQTGVANKGGHWVFQLNARVLRKDEATVRRIFADVEEYLKTGSIYAGKALKVRFRDNDGDLLGLPEPAFMDLSRVDRNGLIYSDDVQEAIETNLFTPIERVEDCTKNGIDIKRGVLLGGPYGTGKTLAATVAAKIAVENGVTFLYVARADELADAIEFAKQYQTTACVVFCEDIDRTVSGERSVEMDDILNILDGIDTKHSRIITVLTTNHLENINKAMLRPGRLDAVINVLPPDAKAVEKLIRLYGQGTIAETEDLAEAGVILEGTIPAVIAEVVKRAKLAQLRLQPKGTEVTAITAEAVVIAAQSMRHQIELLSDKPKEPAEPTFAEAIAGGVKLALNGTVNTVEAVHKDVRSIRDAVV